MLQVIPLDPILCITLVGGAATVVLPGSLHFFLIASFPAVDSMDVLCTFSIVTAMLMQETRMGTTVAVLDVTINLVGCGVCRGMLVGGPQVGTAAGGSQVPTGREDACRALLQRDARNTKGTRGHPE
jgi:hypothetical protein